jgi:hypothetical protein
VKENEMGRASNTNGEKKIAYRMLVEKPERNRPLGKSRRSCVDNIKMDLRPIELVAMDWIDLAQDREI